MIDEGRRIYLSGNTYPIKDAINSAGGHWDSSRRMWWIGASKRGEIQAVIDRSSQAPSRQEETGTSLKVKGKARYKGHLYYVLWNGMTSRGEAFKLAFRDGSKTFWANAQDVTWEKRYQDRDGYPTIASINAYAAKMKNAAQKSRYGDAGWMHNGCSECRRLGDWCSRCAFDEFDN